MLATYFPLAQGPPGSGRQATRQLLPNRVPVPGASVLEAEVAQLRGVVQQQGEQLTAITDVVEQMRVALQASGEYHATSLRTY